MRLIAILCALIIWMSVGIKPLASDYLYATYIHSKEKDQAIQYLKYAIAADKGDTNKLAELARQYMRQKNFPSAYAVIIEILNHNNGDVVPWAIWAMRAVCEIYMGQIPAAEKSVARSLEYNPEFDGASMLKKNIDKAKKE